MTFDKPAEGPPETREHLTQADACGGISPPEVRSTITNTLRRICADQE